MAWFPEIRQAPRWLPIAAVAILLAVAAFVIGPGRALRAAREVVAEPTFASLPGAAAWSLLRMTVSYVISLAFAWVVGYPAATNPRAARILLPLLDIGQSVPVLGFFPAAIYVFIALLGGGRLALEMASVFLIFTCQSWNLAFAVYEGISTIPSETRAAADSLGVRGLLRLRTLLLPTCVPTLVFNSILSWANGWYFLIACEIIVTRKAQYDLPGLGSTLSHALARGDLPLAVGSLAVLVAVVLVLEFAIWRPLRAWSVRFRYDSLTIEEDAPAALRLPELGIPALVRLLRRLLRALWRRLPTAAVSRTAGRLVAGAAVLWRWAQWPVWIAIAVASVLGSIAVVEALRPPWPHEAVLLPGALVLSFLRIAIAYAIALAWIIPFALWASDHPRGQRVLSLAAQIGASLPATAFFPVLVSLLVERGGGMELISIALALTGMQWYLLFNVLAGVQRVPHDLRESLRSLGMTRGQIHRKLVLPACMPSLVTGSVVAWGGTWNALILSEYVVYRGHTYEVLGLGALLNRATFETGDRAMLILSLAVLVITVVAVNRTVWGPLYDRVNARYRMEG